MTVSTYNKEPKPGDTIIQKIFKQIPEITQVAFSIKGDIVYLYRIDKDTLEVDGKVFNDIIDILSKRNEITFDDFKEAMFIAGL